MPEPFGQPQSTDIFKRASTWIDELYKPVSEPLGSAFGAVGKAFSPKLEQPFRQVGQGLPRLATEAFLSTRGAKLPRAVGFGDVALQSMGQTADQGLSPTQRIGTAGLQTAAFAAAPKVAEAGQSIAGRLAAPMTEGVRKIGGRSLGSLVQTTAEKGGSITGMLGTFEAANAASSAVMGQPDYFKRMLEPEHIASTVATVLPFEALGFPAAVRRTLDVRRAMDVHQGLWFDKLTQQDAADREAQAHVLTREREEEPEVIRSSPAMEHPSPAHKYEAILGPDKLGPKLRGTVVLDDKGWPKQVYHGTLEEFNELDPIKAGAEGLHFGGAEQANQAIGGQYGIHNVRGEIMGAPRVYPSYIRLKNPVYLPDQMLWNDTELIPYLKNKLSKTSWKLWEQRKASILATIKAEGGYDPNKSEDLNLAHGYFDYGDGNNVFQSLLKTDGYDGIIYNNRYEGVKKGEETSGRSYVVFDKSQIVPFTEGPKAMHQGPELITHSAFVPDPTHPENVEYGAHHPEILDRLGVKGFEQRESRNTPQFGYKTTHRPFITREEASALMNRTGQKLDLEAPIQPHSDEIPSATGAGTVAEQTAAPLVDVSQFNSVKRQDDYHKLPRASYWQRPSGELQRVSMHMPFREEYARAAGFVGTHALDDFTPMYNRGWIRVADASKVTDVTSNRYPTEKQQAELINHAIELGKDRVVLHVEGTHVSGLESQKTLWERPKLSAMAIDDLEHSQSLGADARELAEQAKRTVASDRLPTESVAAHAARVNGVSKEVLEKADPQTLLRTFTQLTQHIAKVHLGFDDEKAAFWTEKAARLVGMIGQGQGETRVFPAAAYTQEGVQRAASFYVPRPNPFIGLYVKPFVAPERAMFEFFHGLGHELFHGKMEQLATRPESLTTDEHTALANLHRAADELKLSTWEMADSIQGALRTMVGPMHKGMLDYRQPFYKETPEGRVEYMADLFGIQAMGAASDRSARAFKFADDVMKFGNDDVRNFAAGVYKDIGQLFKHVAEMLKKTFGWSNLSVNRLDRIVENMKHLIASKEEGDRAVETFLTTMQAKDARPWAPTSGLSYDRVNKFYRMIQGEAYDVDAMAFAKDFGPAIVPQTDATLPEVFGAGKRLRWPDFFKPVIQLAKSIPELADMAWLGGNLGTVSHHAAVKMWSFLNVPGTERMDLGMWNKATQTDSRLGRLWSKAALLQNSLEGERQGQFLDRKTISEMPEYKALDEKERTWFNDIFSAERIGKVHIQAALENVNSVKWQLGFALARVVQAADKSLPWQQAQKIGRAIAVIHTDQDRLQEVGGRFGDPALVEEVRAAHELIEGYAQSNPKAVQDALDVFRLDENGQPIDTSSVAGKSKSLVDKYKDYRDKMLGEWQPPDAKNGNWHFLGKPGFSSEVRIGKWTVAWLGKNDKEPSLVAFKEQKDFNAKVQALEKAKLAGDVVWWKGHNKEDQEDLFKGMSPGQFTDYSNFMTAVNNSVFASIKKKYPDATDVLNELQNELRPTAAQAFAALLEAPYMKERRLLGGRETLNMAEGVVHYVNSVAHTVGKRFARGQQALYLNDPKMRANPELQKTARQYFDEVVDPKERGFGATKALIAFNYIFFSPSLAMVEATQQLTNHIPALASVGMPWGEAVKATVKANKDMAEAWIEGRKRGTKLHVYSNPEEHAIIERAVKDGLIDRGWLQEQFHTRDDLPFLNQHNVLAGDGKLLDRNELLGKALYHMYRFGRDAHGMMITMNSEVAALSAYRYFRSKGQGVEEAYRSTWDLTRESMHGGGRSSRPLWYLGVGPSNPGSTVGGLMYTLQMYVYNTVAQMSRYGYNAMFNSKLDASERTAFAKGFASMMGAQLFLAGTMGLPVTSQMFALIEQMFPNTEPKRRARELFYGAGKWINDKTHILKQDEDMGHFVEDAAMDGLMGQVTPVQMSNRFELGVLLGVDPYQGFSWKNVVGPGGSLLEQILLKPAQALAQGHPLDAAIEAFPNSNVRRLATLASNGWQLRNKDDRLNSELTAAESSLLALGFTPSKVADFRAQNEMKRRAEKVHALEQKKFHEDVAQMVVEGRVEDAQTALVHRAQTTEGYSPREGARRVAELVQSKTEPFDPYEKGARSGGTYSTAELFPQAPATGSEVDRALRRTGIEQQLGFPEVQSKTALAEAQYIDELRRMNPMMSKQEAKELLQRQLHPSRFRW